MNVSSVKSTITSGSFHDLRNLPEITWDLSVSFLHLYGYDEMSTEPSYISMNWRGKPLISHEVIVNLIAATSTQKGLKIEAEIDSNIYTKGIHVPEEELEKLHIERASFHGEWNYTILSSASRLSHKKQQGTVVQSSPPQIMAKIPSK